MKLLRSVPIRSIRHFGDALPAGGTEPGFPRHLVADLNGDGAAELIFAFSDAQSARRRYRLESLKYIPLGNLLAELAGVEYLEQKLDPVQYARQHHGHPGHMPTIHCGRDRNA